MRHGMMVTSMDGRSIGCMLSLDNALLGNVVLGCSGIYNPTPRKLVDICVLGAHAIGPGRFISMGFYIPEGLNFEKRMQLRKKAIREWAQRRFGIVQLEEIEFESKELFRQFLRLPS